MSHVLKVFGTVDERRKLADEYGSVADYDAFTLVEVGDAVAKSLARTHLVEDITSQYQLRIGDAVADTSKPRVTRRGKVRPHKAYAGLKQPGPGRHHYIVQFVGPIKSSWLARVRKAGGEPRAPFQGFAYVVRADKNALAAIAALPIVRWAGHLPYNARLGYATRRRLEGGKKKAATDAAVPRTRLRDGVYSVLFFGPDDLAKGVAAVRRLGFKVLDRPDDKRLLIVESQKPASARGAQLNRLSAVHGVEKIRQRSIKRPSNDVSAGLMGATVALSPGLALSGDGETICVCDTGLDTGDPATIHPDFKNRVVAIRSFPITPDFPAAKIHNPGANDGPSDRDSGHGTHVAGSVLGDGSASSGLPGLAGSVRGLSHKAKLVFQAVEQEVNWKDPADEKELGRFVLAGIPADLTVLLRDAYNRGARIHSNSWGGGDPGAYDAQCEQLDRFVWKNKDMCVLVAAGNDGTDNDGDGTINPMSVTSPGTSKNCITVGASENRRPNFNGETYGDWWPDDYPAVPFKNAPMADDPGQIVAFSSRGPTADGRFKPDVIAPGTFILSTRSTRIAANNKAWAAFPPSKLYFHMGGTSMATPLTAGAVGLLRQYVRQKQVVGGPTAALLKALLIASATRLANGPSRLVDNDQGYGLINLESVLKPSSSRKLRMENVSPGLTTGEAWRRTITLSAKAPLRIVLAYSDFPGPALVNNLNLIVRAPNGARYAGNQAKAGSTTLDASNNVERIDVASAVSGKWSVEVIGANVPQGPQPFALVIVARQS
jgi:subtilisin family serine protease